MHYSPETLAFLDAWMDDAACRGEDPALFFTERGESASAAKAICARCPVTVRCLAYARHHHIHHGIWGGMSEYDRDAAVRRARRDRP